MASNWHMIMDGKKGDSHQKKPMPKIGTTAWCGQSSEEPYGFSEPTDFGRTHVRGNAQIVEVAVASASKIIVHGVRRNLPILSFLVRTLTAAPDAYGKAPSDGGGGGAASRQKRLACLQSHEHPTSQLLRWATGSGGHSGDGNGSIRSLGHAAIGKRQTSSRCEDFCARQAGRRSGLLLLFRRHHTSQEEVPPAGWRTRLPRRDLFGCSRIQAGTSYPASETAMPEMECPMGDEASQCMGVLTGSNVGVACRSAVLARRLS